MRKILKLWLFCWEEGETKARKLIYIFHFTESPITRLCTLKRLLRRLNISVSREGGEDRRTLRRFSRVVEAEGEEMAGRAFATKANCKARENRVANGNKPILRRNTQPAIVTPCPFSLSLSCSSFWRLSRAFPLCRSLLSTFASPVTRLFHVTRYLHALTGYGDIEDELEVRWHLELCVRRRGTIY